MAVWSCSAHRSSACVGVPGPGRRKRSGLRPPARPCAAVLAAPAPAGCRRRPDPLRERYTSRGGPLLNLIGLLILVVVYAALGYVTYYFASRTFVELWHEGYGSATNGSAPPEFNLALRFFVNDSSSINSFDVARTDFNVFLRVITIPILFLYGIIAAGVAAESIAIERTKNTWLGLITTPLTGREILHSKLRASLGPVPRVPAHAGGVWTLGLLAGFVHPLGYVTALVELAVWTWFCMAIGLRMAISSGDAAASGTALISLLILPIASSSTLSAAGAGKLDPAGRGLLALRDVALAALLSRRPRRPPILRLPASRVDRHPDRRGPAQGGRRLRDRHHRARSRRHPHLALRRRPLRPPDRPAVEGC